MTDGTNSLGARVDALVARARKIPARYVGVVVVLCIALLTAYFFWSSGNDQGESSTVLVLFEGKEVRLGIDDIPEGYTRAANGTFVPPVKTVSPETGENGNFSRPATEAEMKKALAQIEALKAQLNASAPESAPTPAPAEAVRTTATGVAIVNPPTIEVVDGRTVSEWRDSARIGLAEKITLGRDELTMQESGNTRRGAFLWEELRNSNELFQASYLTAKEDRFGDFLINKISIWAPSTLRYENDDGDRVAVLVKVDQLEYRLWEITPNTRSVPTSKDDLKPVQYAWTSAPAPATTRDVETVSFTPDELAAGGTPIAATETPQAFSLEELAAMA